MKIYVTPTPQELAAVAADFIAGRLAAITKERIASLAVSGGSTPALLFPELAERDVAWDKLIVAQVDERVAPEGDPDRNLTQLKKTFFRMLTQPINRMLAMPAAETDLSMAAASYATTLQAAVPGGNFDIIHLGLGDDGHTASLVPGDPVLEVTDRDVWYTDAYKGRQRLTLTYPAINRAGLILWLIAGADKAPMLKRLADGDQTIPAGRINQENAVIFADQAAMSAMPPEA